MVASVVGLASYVAAKGMALRMTLTELAERVGLTLANLSTLEAICRGLECQPGDLLGYAPELGHRGEPEPTAGADGPEASIRAKPLNLLEPRA